MRRQLSARDVKKIVKSLPFMLNYDKKSRFENCNNIILKDGFPVIFLFEGRYFPTLKYLISNPVIKKVVVDMGAVPYVTKGADIMRPGIVMFDDANKGDMVMVVDEVHHKPLAVGILLESSSILKEKTSGPAVKNIHWIGDKIWSLIF